MFFVDCKKTVKAKENRYDMANASMNGSVRFFLFLNRISFLLKADFQNQSYFL